MKRKRQPEELLPLTPASIAILVVLADAPLHGYGIVKALERETDGHIVPGAGTLYAALQRMVTDGLIEETEGDGSGQDERRRYYSVTQFGRDVARAELRRLSRLLEQPGAKRLAPSLRQAFARGEK